VQYRPLIQIAIEKAIEAMKPSTALTDFKIEFS
jgi:hypothetical protein